jgi:hypothetical protein
VGIATREDYTRKSFQLAMRTMLARNRIGLLVEIATGIPGYQTKTPSPWPYSSTKV